MEPQAAMKIALTTAARNSHIRTAIRALWLKQLVESIQIREWPSDEN
jgi:hypothetical protein